MARDSVREIDRAERLVARIVEGWPQDPTDPVADLGHLHDRAARVLAAEAAHNLRQVLTRIMGTIDLAVEKDRRRGVDSALLERVEGLNRALERATDIVATHLDPHEVAKLLIQVQAQPFDLGERWGKQLEALGVVGGRVDLDLELEPTPIEGDPHKLVDALTFVTAHLADRAGPDATVRVRLAPTRGHAEVFMGVPGDMIEPRALVEDLDRPLDLTEQAIDLPYVRAVIERHGGSVVVANHDGAVGLEVQLPLPPPGRR